MTDRPTASAVPGPSVTAVVVAYNRRALLLEAVAAIRAQTTAVRALVVVDNASTDASGDAALQLDPDIDLVRLPRNTGGAGGFATGLAVALERHDPEWIWLMDDDTIPTPTALEALLAALGRVDGAVLGGSRVVWTDGGDHPMNTPRRSPFALPAERRTAKLAGAQAVRSSSFVSMLVRSSRVREVGLPIADYFIWNDDFEFSTRVLRGHRGLFVPGSVVVHKTKARADTDVDPGDRFFYEVRNKVWLFVFGRGLAPAEKAVYIASTARRWIRTLRLSRDRRALLGHLRRGMRAGLRAPRDNAVVLAGLGIASDAVGAVEGTR